MIRLGLILSFGFLLNQIHAQVPDTLRVQEIESVSISILPTSIYHVFSYRSSLNTEQLRAINANDAGELMRYIPGINLKSYGGLGGMKTISSRGLSSQDNAIVVDGFLRSNGQSGVQNLALLETDQLSSLSRYPYSVLSPGLPVSAVLAGNVINMRSFLADSKKDTSIYSLGMKAGSFDTYEGFGSLYWSKKKTAFAAFVKYRSSLGDYPFEYENGTQTIRGIRSNNDFEDLNASLAYSYLGEKITFRTRYRGMMYNQGVPGAVILYNDYADERLTGYDHRIENDLTRINAIGKWRIYQSVALNNLDYSDPDYLGNELSKRSTYENGEHVVGGTYYFQVPKSEKNHLQIGIENKIQALESNVNFVNDPLRSLSSGMLDFMHNFRRYQLRILNAVQHVVDLRSTDGLEGFFYTPTVAFSRHQSKKGFAFELDYKRSLRIPSFNDLYYGGIGNIDLEPETANQFLFQTFYARQKPSRLQLGFQSTQYLNLVNNKILAIPTKNLFVWSMQNVGRVLNYGADFDLNMRYSFADKSKFLELTCVYNWMKSIDVTDEEAPSYGHQIAYVPEHSIQLDLSYTHNAFSVRFMNNMLSHRYVLNENTDANLIEGFWISDVSVQYHFRIARGNQLTCQLAGKNLWNSSYAYVRNYLMPGTHYQLTVKYVF